MKMDDLHLSDFREMRLKSKGDFYIAYSAVMGIGVDAYLREIYSFLARGLAVPILRQTNHIFSDLRNFIAHIGSSPLLRNMKIFHPVTPYILFH